MHGHIVILFKYYVSHITFSSELACCMAIATYGSNMGIWALLNILQSCKFDQKIFSLGNQNYFGPNNFLDTNPLVQKNVKGYVLNFKYFGAI